MIMERIAGAPPNLGKSEEVREVKMVSVTQRRR